MLKTPMVKVNNIQIQQLLGNEVVLWVEFGVWGP